MLYLYNDVDDWKAQCTSYINGGEMGLCLLTCGFVVGFIPVKDDEGGTTFHSDHGKVRRRRTGRTGHCGFPSFILWEITQRLGDGAWLIWFLIRFIHHVRSWDNKNWICSRFQCQSRLVLKWQWRTSGAKLNIILNGIICMLHDQAQLSAVRFYSSIWSARDISLPVKRSLPMASILDAGTELKADEFSHVSNCVTVKSCDETKHKITQVATFHKQFIKL